MKDQFNNESTFDFLDYTDSNKTPLTVLHEGSVFPKNSYNNKLLVQNLKGITVVNNALDDTNTCQISFSDTIKDMHDNFIEVNNLTVDCVNFYNNTISNSLNLDIKADCYNNTLNGVSNIQIINTLENCTIPGLINSTINAILRNCKFKKIQDCVFNEGTIENVTSYCDLISINFNKDTYNLLYNTSKVKELYLSSEKVKVVCIPDVIFYRGMIIMHSGIEPIPEGWAPCDGKEYTYHGVTSKTPNLKNRFIKAVTSESDVKETDNDDINEKGELVLKEAHLPKHSHPHKAHTHSVTATGSITVSDDFTALTSASKAKVKPGEGDEVNAGDTTTSSTVTVSDTVSVSVSGSASEVTSTEADKTWENKPIKLIPNYYSLIFIMKL
jgi:hypothetical protein